MRRVGIVGAFLLVLALVLWFVLVRLAKAPETPSNGSATLQQFQDNKQGVKLSYPAEAKQLTLTTQDSEDKFLFRANSEGQTPYLITLRYEEGLRLPSQLAKTSTMDLLLANTDKVLPDRYPDYNKLSEERFNQSGKQAARVSFTYISTDGKVVHQDLYIVLKDENQAFYLSMQAKLEDFEALEARFKLTANSLSI